MDSRGTDGEGLASLGEREARALAKQALRGVVESAESEPKPHHCVDRRVVKMLQQQHPWDPIQKVVTSFSLGSPAEDGEPSARGSHPNPGGFPAAQVRARGELMGQSRAQEEPEADVAVERGCTKSERCRDQGRRWREGDRKRPSG